LLTKSLPQHELDKHRANVCLVMEVMVRKHDKFGWDQMNAGMRQMIREDWLHALADYPVDEVRTACRIHTQEQPGKVPNEGHIKAIILRQRAKVVAALPKPVEPETQREEASPERKARIAAMVASFANSETQPEESQ